MTDTATPIRGTGPPGRRELAADSVIDAIGTTIRTVAVGRKGYHTFSRASVLYGPDGSGTL